MTLEFQHAQNLIDESLRLHRDARSILRRTPTSRESNRHWGILPYVAGWTVRDVVVLAN